MFTYNMPSEPMTTPPPMPNALTTSALPSPVVSRSRRTPPRGPETATSTSPFSNTTICRDRPIDSATTSAQKPGGSVSPALSEAHTGLLTCGGDATSKATSAATRTRDMRGILLDGSCGNIPLPRPHQPSLPPSQEGRGGRGVRTRRYVVPSLHAFFFVVQAATSPSPQ